MNASPWSLFPYPTIADGHFSDGSILAVHPDCIQCPQRYCLTDRDAQIGELKICRYGLSYARVDDERIVLGVVSADTDNMSPRARKRNRKEPARRVRPMEVKGAIGRARDLGPGVVDDFVTMKSILIDEAKNDPEFQKSIAAQFRGEYEDSLNQSHDFLQLMNLVRGNAENLLHERYPGLVAEDAADQWREVGSIYFATLLMRMKMDSLLYLHEINRVHGGERRFDVHPFVLKYVRIYDWQAKQKNLRIVVAGKCHARIKYNSDAVGSVVQGLLDNMVKYAPPGSTATIVFDEAVDDVRLTFESLGPRIEIDERIQIFMPKYRARAARQAEAEGQGIGLAAVKQVSDALSLGIEVEQSDLEDGNYPARYVTKFTINLRVAN
ncbi:signal transduction histidine kinase [Arthrobacter silviterrae]|uniref:Sensor-like histidine kinase SenX3 n=1 Tax=Arthrobacter silviterrae TaxID=2026658 RepID=A0ABX0DI35_9MICC|nr:ATP-binding protein [Arthrobacter silviterrae]MDQ0278769.1 signal transduction histidine kinase [Arthrobacter silviterrae]NGN83943.1 HAMP domain-containing histidine kinase [Arthrobacter silviterrae]